MELFVSFPFDESFDIIFNIIEGVARENAFTAYRVDQERFAKPIAETIERKIRASHVVIADITGGNPNVMNEVGQARTLGKPLILISQEAPTIAPFNVRGLEILQYDRENLDSLREILSQAFSEATSPNEVLRSMLVPSSLGRPTKDSRFVIAACPLAYRRAMGRVGGYKKLRRTSSDYVGLRGILQAFGLLYRFETLPDIIDPDDCDDCVMQERMNIYCIASPKTNRWTGKLLRKYHEKWVPRLDFRADPASKNLKNIKVALYTDNGLLHPPGWQINTEGDRYVSDFGLILRAPSPYHDDQMITIMAGRSSLGTEAACTALTDIDVISSIRQRLKGMTVDLENHKHAFWALVSMNRATGNGREEAILESLHLHQVDMLHRT